jgi:hypothetical protein
MLGVVHMERVVLLSAMSHCESAICHELCIFAAARGCWGSAWGGSETVRVGQPCCGADSAARRTTRRMPACPRLPCDGGRQAWIVRHGPHGVVRRGPRAARTALEGGSKRRQHSTVAPSPRVCDRGTRGYSTVLLSREERGALSPWGGQRGPGGPSNAWARGHAPGTLCPTWQAMPRRAPGTPSVPALPRPRRWPQRCGACSRPCPCCLGRLD